MKARWIRNSPDMMSALYETEGGPLPKHVAAFAEQDGTLTFYESNIDGGFKKVNALKGSGSSRSAEATFAKLGYVVTKGALTLYPDGYEHAVRMDRKTADTTLQLYCEQKELHVKTEFASACAALLRGDAIAFRDRLKSGWMQELRLLRAQDARNGIRDARHENEVSRIAHEALLDAPRAGDEATAEKVVMDAVWTARSVSLSRHVDPEPGWHLATDPNGYFGIEAGIDAYTRELDRMNAELAAKQQGLLNSNLSDTHLKGRGFGKKNTGEAWADDIPLWERAGMAGSPDAPRIDHRCHLVIGGRKLKNSYCFGHAYIPLDMVGTATTWAAMAMDAYRAWVALAPGEGGEYVGNGWSAQLFTRPEVLP